MPRRTPFVKSKFGQMLFVRRLQKTLSYLKKNQFDAHFFQSSDEALKFIMDTVSGFETFGFGGSDTTHSLNLPDELEKKGKTVYDHNKEGLSPEQNVDFRKKQFSSDCFFCSANAISSTGEIVNVDGVGNRTNAMSFGPKKVIIVAGANKVVDTLDDALKRLKEIAPLNIKRLGSHKTPCLETGRCMDCQVQPRICNSLSVIYHGMKFEGRLNVIVVAEETGF